jgi:ribosomal protein L37E
MDENKLTADFNSETEEAFRTAWHSEKGGDENWNKFMSAFNVTPLTKDEKEMLLGSEMKIARGAFPIELRRVYEGIIMKYRPQAQSSQKLTDAINGFNMDAKVLEYYQKIKPFSGLGDIFKNAQTGTAKYSSGLKAEKQHTIKCRNCGAPRLEEMQYDSCLFCGSKLFETA